MLIFQELFRNWTHILGHIFHGSSVLPHESTFTRSWHIFNRNACSQIQNPYGCIAMLWALNDVKIRAESGQLNSIIQENGDL